MAAPAIGLGALQFSKELAAKYGLKSCLTLAVVPLRASSDRQSCLLCNIVYGLGALSTT